MDLLSGEEAETERLEYEAGVVVAVVALEEAAQAQVALQVALERAEESLDGAVEDDGASEAVVVGAAAAAVPCGEDT